MGAERKGEERRKRRKETPTEAKTARGEPESAPSSEALGAIPAELRPSWAAERLSTAEFFLSNVARHEMEPFAKLGP